MAECLSHAKAVLRKKNLTEARSMDTPLERCLTIWHLVFYGIAHMAGAGIYVLSGTLIKSVSGPAAAISFLFCGLSALFTGLCYAEFATLIPRTGSCYTFTYVTLGELAGFVVGWTMLSDLIISLAAVAKGFASTVDSLTGHAIKNYTLEHVGRLTEGTMLDDTLDFVAFGLIIILILLTICGANISLSLNIGLSAIQIICLIIITVACFVYGDIENWSPESGGFFPYGFKGIVTGSSIAVFAFSGFEAITNAAEECKEPRKDLPVALIASLAAILVLYCSSSLGLSYLVNYKLIDTGSPFVEGFISAKQYWMKYVAAVGTLIATGATKLATMYVLPRLFYAIAADGLIFKCFAWVDKRTQVPLAGLFFGGSISAVLALLINIGTLAEFVSMGILVSYLFIGIDLLFLRYIFFHGTKDYQSLRVNPSEEETPKIRSWAAPVISKLPFLETHMAVQGTIMSFIGASFLLGIITTYLVHYNQWWSWSLFGLVIIVLTLNFLVLTVYEPEKIHDMYESPLMPISPCLTVVVNAILIVGIQPMTWLRCAIWTFIGMAIYLLYGIRHSTARQYSNGDYVNLDEQEVQKVEEKEDQKLLNNGNSVTNQAEKL